jgi:hypothetical protein
MRLDADDSNTTKRPSPEIELRMYTPLSPSACSAAEPTEARRVLPAWMSTRKESHSPFVSWRTRFVAEDEMLTNRPSSEIPVARLSPSPGAAKPKLASVVSPVWRSWTYASMTRFVSSGTSLDWDEKAT